MLIYKFKWRFLPYLWLALFVPLTILLSTEWARENGLVGGAWFTAVALSFVLGMGYLLFLALSDIEVDRAGIARRAFWFRWQALRWCDVSKFHISPSRSPETGQQVRAFVLSGKPGSAALFGRRITFQEHLPAMLPLLEEIDRWVSEHQIPIQDLTGSDNAGRKR